MGHYRNWTAKPYAKPETIGENVIQRLCFEVVENGDHLQGSRTVIKRPSQQLMAEVFKIPENILIFNENQRKLYSAYFSHNNPIFISGEYKDSIIELGGKYTSKQIIFVKGVRIQEENSLFSYDLCLENITPDRIYAHIDSVRERES